MTSTDAASEQAVRARRNYSFLLALTLLGLLVLLWAALTFATPNFLTERNIPNLLRQGSMIAILALGQTFVIITAGIDLSVGAIAGYCTVVIALLLQSGVPIWLAIVITLLVGLAIGIFHSFGITKMGLPPFIITLATLTSLRGIGLLMTNGATISITNKDFTGFATQDFLGIPSLFWMVILIAIPSYIFLNHTRWGRYIFAVGSNPEAARLSGVRVQAILYLAYSLSAVFAAFVGVLLAVRLGIGNATQADGYELPAIASSVIGGTSQCGAGGAGRGPRGGAGGRAAGGN